MGAAAYFMPKMMDGMDETQKKEMQDQMKGSDPSELMKNMFGGGGAANNDSDSDDD